MIIVPKKYKYHIQECILYENAHNFFEWEKSPYDKILNTITQKYFLCLKIFQIIGEALVEIKFNDVKYNENEYLIYVLTPLSGTGWLYSLYFEILV